MAVEVKLQNCSLIQGKTNELIGGGDSSPSVFMKSDLNQNAVIQFTFTTRRPLTELGIINYRGDKSSSYGIKGIILVVNSVTVFSGDLTQSSGQTQNPFGLRLYINQVGMPTNNIHTIHRQMAQTMIPEAATSQRRPEKLPSLTKHRSQDISVSSQQSDMSSGKVTHAYKIKKHPKVANSINNLFKFGDGKNSERSRSSQRARIVDRSNKLQSDSNYLSLFSKVYHPLERKKTDGDNLIRDISNLDDNILSNRTIVDGERRGSYGQGLTDYGLPPHPSRKSLYMADLLKRNMSMTGKTINSEKKQPNRSRGPLVERISFIGDYDAQNERNSKVDEGNVMITSFGGLKIFQKVSEDIIQKKNGASLRTSFANQSSRQKSCTELMGLIQQPMIIPELPQGYTLKLTLWSNWGDADE